MRLYFASKINARKDDLEGKLKIEGLVGSVNCIWKVAGSNHTLAAT